MRPLPRRYEHEIRVLIVEDSPADAELMLLALRRSGLRTVHHLVHDEPGFRAALEGFRPDVVLADSKLPRFSGRRALRIARRFDPILPVIMVTGTLKEFRIVRLTRLGLANYVLKDNLNRLSTAVPEVLDRAEAQRQAAASRAALEAGERRFRAVAEASGDGLLIVDAAGRTVFWNAAAERIFGYASREVLGTDFERLIPERYRPRHQAGWVRSLTAAPLPAPFTAEVTALRADGAEFPAELTVSAWEEAGKRYFSAQVRDITLRKEEARTRNVLSQVAEQTLNSVVITDLAGTIEYVNPAFERLTGYAAHEVVGRTPRVLKSGRQSDDIYRRLWQEITAGRPFRGEFTNRRKDGAEYQQDTVIFPIVGEDGGVERFVGIGLDVTEVRLLEAQFRQSQKMEAVGHLAGGIAHDFNNILTGVLTNAQLLEMSLGELPEEEAQLLRDVVQAARRGSELVKRLMGLVRRGAGAPVRVDLRGAVDEAVRTVRRMLPATVEISVEKPPHEVPCIVDETELQQAVLNLCNNARDAMSGTGRLAIRTLVAGDAAVLEVSDSGVGMEPAVLERIFEPFFTTKEVGKGTGLGLSMVYGFAQRAGGKVTAESHPGVGSTFRLTLPLALAEPKKSGPTGDELPTTGAVGAHGTVLVAEDQDDIRRITQKLLEGMGYRVLTASDGEEAVAILARERGRVDLVLSDVVMPRGGGGLLYRSTLDWPDRPRFVFMTGYAGHELNGDEALFESVPLLPKPWTIQELEAAVSGVMLGSPR